MPGRWYTCYPKELGQVQGSSSSSVGQVGEDRRRTDGERLMRFDWTEVLSPLVLFEREAKRLGYTMKVVGDYSYTKSRRNDSPRIRFNATTENGIRVIISHPSTGEIEHLNIDHGIDMHILDSITGSGDHTRS